MEAQFKVVWANHGDDISLQYAGTGALKSGFTRTGVRTKAGLLDDGVKSGLRYYLNNFSDGRKQDALDLVTGTFVISKGACMPVFVWLAAGLLHSNALLEKREDWLEKLSCLCREAFALQLKCHAQPSPASADGAHWNSFGFEPAACLPGGKILNIS